MVLLILNVTLLSSMHVGYAQTTNFSTKGAVAGNSNFRGAIMWTIIDGNKGTIIIQSPVGRGLVHTSISPSTTCGSSVPTCLSSNVIDATDTDIFKAGDTTRFSIDLNAKQETVSILTGVLAGVDVTVNLSKVWNATSVSAGVNSTTSSNATAMINSTTSSNATAMVHSPAPRHFTLSLNESVGISGKG
ncbi:hypothetical protein [Candidatus Nitrosotalea okcheonensis]|nr:hypothetical protein [Candidatus Nitrosotalea okcheonensis]MDE1728429.1 hypothetical protein [Nitrososphaerota archaeon]